MNKQLLDYIIDTVYLLVVSIVVLLIFRLAPPVSSKNKEIRIGVLLILHAIISTIFLVITVYLLQHPILVPYVISLLIALMIAWYYNIIKMHKYAELSVVCSFIVFCFVSLYSISKLE